MEIVVSHYNEDLEWLGRSSWPVVIVEHEGSSPWFIKNVKERYCIPNHGREATAFLKYIIERYYTLPDRVAFIHGHESSWHQKGDRPLLHLIRDANVSKYSFIPLNNYWVSKLLPPEVTLFAERWKIYMKEDLPRGFQCHVCAQFIVSREAIQHTPKERYIELFDKVMNGEDKRDAVILEHIWHFLFGEPLQMQLFTDYFDPPIKEYHFMKP
jgi:hypothetical protein